MSRNVLIPLDGSPLAEDILPQLGRLALEPDLEWLLFRVCPLRVLPGIDHAPPIRDDHLVREAMHYVDSVAHRLRLAGRRVRGRVVQADDPAQAILSCADEEESSLIALSTHGRSGVTRVILGSTAENVLRAAHAPLLLARSFARPSKSTPFRNLVLPVVGSPLSCSAATALLAFVKGVDARVTLVHVLEDKAPAPHWQIPGDPLGEVEKRLRAALLPVETEIRSGDPTEEILKVCRGRDADLLVMSTHGRTGPARWLLGSVTESVLRETPLPMLVVPAAAAPRS